MIHLKDIPLAIQSLIVHKMSTRQLFELVGASSVNEVIPKNIYSQARLELFARRGKEACEFQNRLLHSWLMHLRSHDKLSFIQTEDDKIQWVKILDAACQDNEASSETLVRYCLMIFALYPDTSPNRIKETTRLINSLLPNANNGNTLSPLVNAFASKITQEMVDASIELTYLPQDEMRSWRNAGMLSPYVDNEYGDMIYRKLNFNLTIEHGGYRSHSLEIMPLFVKHRPAEDRNALFKLLLKGLSNHYSQDFVPSVKGLGNIAQFCTLLQRKDIYHLLWIAYNYNRMLEQPSCTLIIQISTKLALLPGFEYRDNLLAFYKERIEYHSKYLPSEEHAVDLGVFADQIVILAKFYCVKQIDEIFAAIASTTQRVHGSGAQKCFQTLERLAPYATPGQILSVIGKLSNEVSSYANNHLLGRKTIAVLIDQVTPKAIDEFIRSQIDLDGHAEKLKLINMLSCVVQRASAEGARLIVEKIIEPIKEFSLYDHLFRHNDMQTLILLHQALISKCDPSQRELIYRNLTAIAKDSTHRARAYRALGSFAPYASKEQREGDLKLLLEGHQDQREVIRGAAILALGDYLPFCDPGQRAEVFSKLITAREKDLEVRGYASRALSMLAPNYTEDEKQALFNPITVLLEGKQYSHPISSYDLQGLAKYLTPLLHCCTIEQLRTLAQLSCLGTEPNTPIIVVKFLAQTRLYVNDLHSNNFTISTGSPLLMSRTTSSTTPSPCESAKLKIVNDV